MFKFIVFDIFCWFGLCALIVFFIRQKRKKTLLLRTLIKKLSGKALIKWDINDKSEEFLPEYSTRIDELNLRIGKYGKTDRDGKISYSCKLSVVTGSYVAKIFTGKKIEALYNKTDQSISQEIRRCRRVISDYKERTKTKVMKKNNALVPV